MTKPHKLSYCYKGDTSWGRLYDLVDDSREEHNLYNAPGYTWIQRELEQRLLNWLIETQQPQVHGAAVALA